MLIFLLFCLIIAETNTQGQENGTPPPTHTHTHTHTLTNTFSLSHSHTHTHYLCVRVCLCVSLLYSFTWEHATDIKLQLLITITWNTYILLFSLTKVIMIQIKRFRIFYDDHHPLSSSSAYDILMQQLTGQFHQLILAVIWMSRLWPSRTCICNSVLLSIDV